MLHYADIIQALQDNVGLRVSSFHDIGKSALAFHSLRAAEIARNNRSSSNNNEYNHTGKNNNSIDEEEQVAEDEYASDDPEFEKQRFTDEYHENFTDEVSEAEQVHYIYRFGFDLASYSISLYEGKSICSMIVIFKDLTQ